MILRRNKNLIFENPRNGRGFLSGSYITDKEIFNGVTMIAEMELEPNSEIGYHMHKGDGELYYISDGEGIFVEKDNSTNVSNGDYCIIFDGEGHGLKNTSKHRKLKFLAVVFKEYKQS